MKNVLLIFMCLALNIGFAGDGTLPVIRNVQIDFLNSGPGLNQGLPSCIRVNFNSRLKQNSTVSKKIRLKNANLIQTINLTNQNGDVKINLKSKHLKTKLPLNSIRRDLNHSEFMNELNINNETLVQHIQLNAGSTGANCLSK